MADCKEIRPLIHKSISTIAIQLAHIIPELHIECTHGVMWLILEDAEKQWIIGEVSELTRNGYEIYLYRDYPFYRETANKLVNKGFRVRIIETIEGKLVYGPALYRSNN